MSQIDQPTMTGAGLHASECPSPFFTVRLLNAASRLAIDHRWVLFATITCLAAWGHVSTMASRHLDHDELFTFYIAQAPTVGRMITLTHTVDLHPPLSYLLVRSAFAVLGATAWSCRLPFLLAFLLFSALLFSFVSRLLSPLYGLIVGLLIWSSPYAHLATEARSYSMVLCFTALMLVSWYKIVDLDESDHSRLALVALSIGGIGLLLSHVLGALAYGSFLIVEAIRFATRRRRDWRLWTALLLPLPSVLAYLPLIRLRSDLLFSPWSQASPRRLAICYWEHLRYFVTPFAVIILIALAWPFCSKERNASPQRLKGANVALGWLLLLLLVVPLEIAILFARTGTAFYERYGVVALIPVVLFPALFLGLRTHSDRRAAGSVAILLAILFVFNTSGKAYLTEKLANITPPKLAARVLFLTALPPVAPAPLGLPIVPAYLNNEFLTAPPISDLEQVFPDLPLVAGTAPTFLELDRYQNAVLTQRLHLLTNHEAASAIAHNTVFDHYEQVAPVFPIRGQVEPYCTFLQNYSEFLVLGGYNYQDTWLLRKLEIDGAKMHIVGNYDDGVIEEHQVYKVRRENARCGT